MMHGNQSLSEPDAESPARRLLLRRGVISLIFAALFYQARNLPGDGIILWLLVTGYTAVLLFMRAGDRGREARISNGVFAIGLAAFGWFWIVPEEHGTGWLITSAAAVLQTLPFFMFGVRERTPGPATPPDSGA